MPFYKYSDELEPFEAESDYTALQKVGEWGQNKIIGWRLATKPTFIEMGLRSTNGIIPDPGQVLDHYGIPVKVVGYKAESFADYGGGSDFTIVGIADAPVKEAIFSLRSKSHSPSASYRAIGGILNPLFFKRTERYIAVYSDYFEEH